MCKIDMLVVELKITLILHVPLPYSYPSAEFDHFLESSEQLQITLAEMGELEAILDKIAIEK